jgi:hypothetical protein
MVKLVLTDSLARKIVTTFTALDPSSLVLLPPEARRTFQEISSRFPPSTHGAATEKVTHASDPEDVEAVEGFRWVDHSSLFVLAAAAKEHWTLEHAEGSRSGAQNSFFFFLSLSNVSSLAGHISSAKLIY